ncbi:distal tail protein Dit [Clostridium botulinum]|uniref:distal tail protein Dit n=1 Tax=Clostridium botulinum TaxID=1491 RepID=UPI00077378E3|nr:distal tail protein Dit [Clostridium botulinum]NFL39683.1 phage tail protein [Clostridium botulinum]NFL66521.1 phage tail protein [Clostridium botulinum]NFN09531.1 phage tail protein [Clostridium botulinum]NFN26162.1 phage tail protein [Clostridium botulinum]NFN33093.1 phage tail protein [Clostridium botulinum]
MSYNIYFNNKSNEDLGIEVIKRPFIPIPKRKIKTIDVEGHDGSYYVDEETYEDIVISIEFNFIENDLYNIRNRIRNIKFWLENIDDNKLKLDDDRSFYYKVKNLEIENFNYEELYEIQKFTVDFIVEPYQYINFSKREKQLYNNSFVTNDWYLSKPIYRLVGSGICDFTVNGTTINCNIDKELIIDTEHDKILAADKKPAIGKTNIKSMQDLYLKHGRNNYSWAGNFKIYYIPNYRVI